MKDGDAGSVRVIGCLRVTAGFPRWPDIQDSASAPGTEGVQDREINCVSGLHAGQ